MADHQSGTELFGHGDTVGNGVVGKIRQIGGAQNFFDVDPHGNTLLCSIQCDMETKRRVHAAAVSRRMDEK
jgi:hypothetical protein